MGGIDGRRRRTGLAMCALLALQACAGGPAAAADAKGPDPVLATYRLPRTDAAVRVSLLVVDCNAERLQLEPGLVVTGSARPGPAFELRRAALESKRFERELELTLHPNGTLASLNGAVTDRRPDAIASIFRIAMNVVTLGLGGVFAQGVKAPQPPACTPEITAALARKRAIEAAIRTTRAEAAKPATAESAMTVLELLAQQLAAVKADELTIESTHGFRLEKTGPQPAQQVSLARVVQPDQPLTLKLVVSAAEAGIADGSDMAPAYRGTADCGAGGGGAICTPIAVPMRMTATLEEAADGRAGTVIASGAATAPAAQWREPARIDLSTGFAGKFAYGASFDAFGMLTEATWTSEARNARALSSIADSVGSAGEIIRAATPERTSEIDAVNADSALLEAKQRLRALQACEEKQKLGLSCD